MDSEVKANEASDPYLMYGFDKKVLHLKNNSNTQVNFTIQVDFVGNGEFSDFKTVSMADNSYQVVPFQDGFSAHWIRVVADKDCNATAYFIYN